MNYKLSYATAKKLKDAGYPQIPQIRSYSEEDNIDSSITVPTLSELIDACGKVDNTLACFELKQLSLGDWEASIYVWERKSRSFKQGKTPEESVAKLYIELNK